VQLVTRADLGWPESAAPSQPTALGVKVHYEGTPVSLGLLANHGECLSEWQDIRASHLANTAEGYVDVAYNYAACPHGYLLEGRGIGRRTGANGNQTLNRAHYAIVGLVGDSGLTEPTPQMLDAIRDGIELLQRNGAGGEIRGHRDGYATSCPGAPLYAWVQAGAPRPTTTNPTEEDDLPYDEPTLRRIIREEVSSPAVRDLHAYAGLYWLEKALTGTLPDGVTGWPWEPFLPKLHAALSHLPAEAREELRTEVKAALADGTVDVRISVAGPTS